MKLNLSIAALLAALIVFGLSAVTSAQTSGDKSLITSGTFRGTLHVGETASYLVMVGRESGDFAAFCFSNASAAGRTILASCKSGNCEFTGKVDQGAECKVDAETQAVLSGSGKVLSVRSARRYYERAVNLNAPVTVVRNLYAAHNGKRGPFFQTTSRARVDKYFTKDFADLIWKDRMDAKNEVGYIDFDPLFAAQDVRIKNFKIGKAQPGEGNMDLADVPVTFKNMGKSQAILFRLLRGSASVWKISDIHYPENDAPIKSLKDHLTEFVGK